MSRSFSRTVALIIVACVVSGTAYAAAPAVTITTTAITATGVTPGGGIAFFGVGLEPTGYHAVVHRSSAVVTASSDTGTASFTFDAPVTWNTIWVVADVKTGLYTITSTPGFPTMRSQEPAFTLRTDALGAVNRMTYFRPFADCLYVQPGNGAWVLKAEDGTTSDVDGQADGGTTVDLPHATPLYNGPDIPSTPSGFGPSGLLFVIDVGRLDVQTVTIDATLLQGAHQ